jgi:Uma2 family endonuclease
MTSPWPDAPVLKSQGGGFGYNDATEVFSMSSIPQRLLTPQEYLAIERKAEFKSEYYAGEMFAMAGATWEHTFIKDNVARHAGNQIADGPCRLLTSDMRVKVDATGLYTYPDIVFVCEKLIFEDNVFDTLLNPRVIVEVLSETTEEYDRGTKLKHYRKVPSIQEVVLIAQDRPLVERYVRQADNGWLLTEFAGLAATFEFSSVPVKIAMTDIYRGVEFSESAAP